jgi:hypothetical protein
MKDCDYFKRRIDMWDGEGANIIEHLASVEDFEVPMATYHAACLRWPTARIPAAGRPCRCGTRCTGLFLPTWRRTNLGPPTADVQVVPGRRAACVPSRSRHVLEELLQVGHGAANTVIAGVPIANISAGRL